MTSRQEEEIGTHSVRQFLERHAWFLALPPSTNSEVLQACTETVAEAGEFLARAGEPCLHWYGVISGFLQMYVVSNDGGETTLTCVRDGHWIGDGTMLKNELRKYDLRSLTASHLVKMPASTFAMLRRTSIEFNQYLCDLMNERMGMFVTMLVASRLLGPEMRVARALLMLAGSHTESQEFPIPQHELALICGLSRQRVNVAISELKKHGFIRSDSQKSILLVDTAGLREYVIDAGSDGTAEVTNP